jgi:methylisocitrate lyase
MEAEHSLQIVGTINAYSSVMAEKVRFKALYLPGAGAANASYNLLDLSMTTLGDMLEAVRRITAATSLPLLVDADTGFGAAFMIGRTVTEMERAGGRGCTSRTKCSQEFAVMIVI